MYNATEPSIDASADSTTPLHVIDDGAPSRTGTKRKLTIVTAAIVVGLLASLTAGLVKQTSTANALTSTKHSLVATSNRLHDSLQTVTAERNRAQARFTATEARLRDTTAKLTTANHTASSLRSQLTATKRQVTTLNQQVASLSQQLNAANGQVSSLNGQLTTTNGQLNTANMNTRKCQAAVGDLRTVVSLAAQFIGYTGDFISAESVDDIVGMQIAVDGMTSTNGQLDAIDTQTSNDVNGCIGSNV
jgi:predicted  nucleic acid-binding Zn-ribbon protein